MGNSIIADFVVIGFSVFVTVIILTWVIMVVIAINEKIKRHGKQ